MQFSGLQLLDSIPLSVVVTDTSGKITNVNRALITMIGRDGQGLIGCPLKDINAEDSSEADARALQMVAGGLKADPYLKEVKGQNGAVPVEVHAGPITENDKVTHVLFTMRSLSQEMQTLQQLQRRNMQLVATAEVAKASTQILNIQELLTKAVDLIRTHFGFYYAAIFMTDVEGRMAALKAATGDAGKQLLEQKHALGVGSKSMVGWVTANNTARIALDVGQEAIRFDNPLLPKTRSEMALPLRVRGQVIGALDVQSTSINAFTTEDIQTVQMLADLIAIAIDNARMFSLSQGKTEALF